MRLERTRGSSQRRVTTRREEILALIREQDEPRSPQRAALELVREISALIRKQREAQIKTDIHA
jgi:hypothetical protein